MTTGGYDDLFRPDDSSRAIPPRTPELPTELSPRAPRPARNSGPNFRRIGSWVAGITSLIVLGVSGIGYTALNNYNGKITREPISLETPVGDEEDSHLGDFIEDKNAVIPVDAAIHSNLKETVTRVLASLTPREERVLRMRFGIGMNTDHTLEEVGQQFSVTRERIRQIEAKALRKLKHPSRSRKMRSFLDV